MFKNLRSWINKGWGDKFSWTTISQFGGSNGVSYSTDMAKNLQEGMRNWNYICLSLISKHISSTTWTLNRDGVELTPIDAHEAIDLFELPNPQNNKREFIERTILQLDLTGNAYWYLDRNIIKRTRRLWILRPDLVTVHIDAAGMLDGYNYTPSPGNTYLYPLENVIHLRHVSPHDEYYGTAPIDNMYSTFKLDGFLRDYEANLFENGARPDYIITTEGGMSEPQLKKFREDWDLRFKGPDKRGAYGIVQGKDAKVTPLNFSNTDHQFVELSSWVKSGILASYGIPEAIFDASANRATAMQADVIFNRECIVPRLEKLREALNKLALTFEAGLIWEYENPVPKDREYMLQANVQYVNAGIMTPNEARQAEGLEPIEGADDLKKPQPAPAFGPPMAPPTERGVRVRKDDGRARRDRIWYAYIAKTKKREVTLREAINKGFEWDRKEIKKRLGGSKGLTVEKDPKPFPPSEAWEKAWRALLEGPGADLFKEFGQGSIDDLSAGLNFDFTNENIRAQFDKLLDKGVKELTGTTRDNLWNKLKEGIERGDSAKDLAAVVDETIDNWKTGESRAFTIARTETTKLSNAGIAGGWTQIKEDLGKKIIKEWITVRDGRERDSHAEADGQEVDSEDPFAVGGESLMFPGDSSGPAEEVVNCRCTMGARLEGE